MKASVCHCEDRWTDVTPWLPSAGGWCPMAFQQINLKQELLKKKKKEKE
jgi:hypothetical protein